MKKIKAIQTKYKGCNFRSRLEARWAVFFDAIKTNWQYEPEGFNLGEAGLYLPDFYLEDIDCWAEVKAKPLNPEERSKAFALSSFTNKPVIELLSIPEPNNISYLAVRAFVGSKFIGAEKFFPVIDLVRWYCSSNKKQVNEGLLCEALAWDMSYYHKKYGEPHPLHFEDGIIINFFEPFGACKDMKTGITKARSARFEFGETPCS